MAKLRQYNITTKASDGKLKHQKVKISIKDGKFIQESEYDKKDYDGNDESLNKE